MDMNPIVAKYLRVFQELMAKEPDLKGALAELKCQGATWAISFRGCVSNWTKNYGKALAPALLVGTVDFSLIWQPAKRRIL